MLGRPIPPVKLTESTPEQRVPILWASFNRLFYDSGEFDATQAEPGDLSLVHLPEPPSIPVNHCWPMTYVVGSNNSRQALPVMMAYCLEMIITRKFWPSLELAQRDRARLLR